MSRLHQSRARRHWDDAVVWLDFLVVLLRLLLLVRRQLVRSTPFFSVIYKRVRQFSQLSRQAKHDDDVLE